MLSMCGHRPLTFRVCALAAVLLSFSVLYTFRQSSVALRLSDLVWTPRVRSACPPTAWSAGQWTPRPPTTNRTSMSTKADAIEFSGFEGCAADREFYWHLGSDDEEQWDRFPGVTSWQWSPPASECQVRPFDGAALLKDMVEQGGWLLMGDSVTENHFFSLSCLLYPHVRATPNYTENPYYDRAWAQNIYLSPSSPLIPHLKLPPGFSIEHTPLVTFRRVDLLLTQTELTDLYADLYSPPENFTLFSDEAVWTLSPDEYLDMLVAPAPSHYRTIIVSTAGHWTTTVFSGLADQGIGAVVEFFGHAMRRWADVVQARLTLAGRNSGQVIVRAYLPGHENCRHEHAPWDVYRPNVDPRYNWNAIMDFNSVFEDVLAAPLYPDIHFLPIDRPGRLRPDAHATGDCLHIMTGAGVIEGWSHYIWHFLTRELPGRIR
ncbi:hypothetical protein B0H21DRAFT_167167 [Amylocystis lapponica]|nr:hypothetical protein B0H21DRAFT_167167 [Amylocystis lapponica]